MKKTLFLALAIGSAILFNTAATADDTSAAFANLGSTPFAQNKYGINVVRGEARLSPRGRGTTEVVVTLDGLTPGTTHVGHIHGGTCAQLTPGTILFGLTPMVISASGKGVSRTEIAATTSGLKDCEWWVAVHEGAADATPQTPAVAVGAVFTRGKRD